MTTNKYLFVFENDNSIILETKILNRPEGTDISKIYYWLKIDKKNLTCSVFKFKSMQKEPEQVRIFEEGVLKFGNDFAYMNGEKFDVVSQKILEDEVHNAVLKFVE